MISLILGLLVASALATTLGVFKSANYRNGLIKPILKCAVVVVVFILVLVINPIGLQRIDAGCVGIKIDRIGNEKGIPVARPVKGWVF